MNEDEDTPILPPDDEDDSPDEAEPLELPEMEESDDEGETSSFEPAPDFQVEGGDDLDAAFVPSDSPDYSKALAEHQHLLNIIWANLFNDDGGGDAGSGFGNSLVLIPCDLTKTSGSAGNASTAPTFVYTAVDVVNAATLGAGLSPTWARRKGKHDFATHGMGYLDTSGTFVLLNCDEVVTTGTCP